MELKIIELLRRFESMDGIERNDEIKKWENSFKDAIKSNLLINNCIDSETMLRLECFVKHKYDIIELDYKLRLMMFTTELNLLFGKKIESLPKL